MILANILESYDKSFLTSVFSNIGSTDKGCSLFNISIIFIMIHISDDVFC